MNGSGNDGNGWECGWAYNSAYVYCYITPPKAALSVTAFDAPHRAPVVARVVSINSVIRRACAMVVVYSSLVFIAVNGSRTRKMQINGFRAPRRVLEAYKIRHSGSALVHWG